MDKDSVETVDDKVVKAWFREVTTARRRTPTGSLYRAAMFFEGFDCKNRLWWIEKAVYYSDPDFSQLVVDEIVIPATPSDRASVIPGSLGEAKMKQACEALKPMPTNPEAQAPQKK